MSSTELATMPTIRPGGVLEVARHLREIWELAEILVRSRMIPNSINTPEAAAAIILKGHELGIGPMQSFDSISVIQGKPTLSPQLMLALIERSGTLQDMAVAETPDSCEITMTRRGRTPQSVRFDRSEAVAMGLAGKDNWRKQFGVMMYWRCVAKACRRVFPDVIAGCYTPDEMGAEVSEDGEILEVEVVPARKLPDQGSGHGRGSYASDDHDAAFKRMLTEAGAQLRDDWQSAWVAPGGVMPHGLPEYPVRSSEVIMHLYEADVAAGRLKEAPTTADENTGEAVPRASIEQIRKMVAIHFARDPEGVRRRAGRFMHRRAMDVALDFVAANREFEVPPDFDPEFNQEGDDSPDGQGPPAPAAAPEAPKKLSKRELAEKVRLGLTEKAAAGRGDAWEPSEQDHHDVAEAGSNA